MTCCRSSWDRTSGPGLLGLGVTGMIAGLHAGLWWDLLLTAIGTVYAYAFLPTRRKRSRCANYFASNRITHACWHGGLFRISSGTDTTVA